MGFLKTKGILMAILISLALAIFPAAIGIDSPNQIVFWNVGQGQWITAKDQKYCYHFDVGGEFYNPTKIFETCARTQNVVFFSHWDWDHIGLFRYLKRIVTNVCIGIPPKGNAKKSKTTLINSNGFCNSRNFSVERLNFNYEKAKVSNDFSQIFIYKNKLLIPGDSPSKMERVWTQTVKHPLKWMSASHHGSKTSTSEYFLQNLNGIRIAVVSARKKVYGHPHAAVIQRLKKHGISMLRTEDWGNIHIIVSF